MKITMENKELKKVKDLAYAAVLKLKNYKLQNIQWEGQIGWWIFEDDGTAEDVLRSFINGELTGNLKKYDEAIKTLKVMLFSNK